MSIVPYAVAKKRKLNDWGGPYVPMQMVPYGGGATNMQMSTTQRARGGVIRSGRTRRTRNKWQLRNQYTNPIYPRPEVKFFDFPTGTVGTPTPVDDTGTLILSLNSIVQGINGNQRIGMQVATKSVYYQCVVVMGGTPANIVLRHILLWDRGANGVPPTVADIFQPSTTSIVVAALNMANRDRFIILADDRITLTTTGDQIKPIIGFRTINQLSTYGNATGEPQTGALYLLLVSDEAVLGTQPGIYGLWRTRYIDN